DNLSKLRSNLNIMKSPVSNAKPIGINSISKVSNEFVIQRFPFGAGHPNANQRRQSLICQVRRGHVP
ncbi:MAG: hypothetical protein ACPLXR_08975, partial [Halothiobacillaceae bacterium]